MILKLNVNTVLGKSYDFFIREYYQVNQTKIYYFPVIVNFSFKKNINSYENLIKTQFLTSYSEKYSRWLTINFIDGRIEIVIS